MTKNISLIFFVLIVVLAACNGSPQQKISTNNSDFEVGLLFECEGIKVYRFSDGGRYHYFTNKGQVISKQMQRTGKTIVHFDEIID